jgi:hypothetical protein
MRSSLNKALWWGCALIFWGEGAIAQPIQLVPQKDSSFEKSEPLPPLPQETLKGFWEGTPPPVVETAFSKLPVRLTSPTLRALRGEVFKEKYTPLLQNAGFEKIFQTLLTGIGNLDQAKEFLLESTLPDKDSLLLNLEWLQGERKKACEKITSLLRSSPTLEWKKQNIYCLYISGETERAKVAAELLGETDPKASLLLNALFDPSIEPSFETSIGASPFLLTLWCRLGQNIPETSLKEMAPSFLALVTQSEKMPLKTRILAGEMALNTDVLKGETLLALLKEAPKEGFLENFAQELKTLNSETLLPLFEKAKRENKLGLIVDLFKPHLSELTPSPETLALAPYLIRGALEKGDKNLAQKWSHFYMREAPDEAVSCLPLLHLAFPQTKWNESQLQIWQAYQTRTTQEQASINSYLVRRVLGALGEPAGSPLKGEPEAPSWRQEKSLFDENDLSLLDSATDSKRKGEVLLLILSMIGETTLKDLPVDKFARLLQALHKAGYTSEARSLALEFLIAKGI